MTGTSFEMPDKWVEDANAMNVSRAEYCRRMIRAGRRQLGYDYQPQETPSDMKSLQLNNDEDRDVELGEWIHKNLSKDTGINEERLINLLKEDIIEAADDLCDQGLAKYRRSDGGWVKTTHE